MKAESRYAKSARIYDLLYVGSGIKDYPAESAELRRIIEESSPGAKTLLDVACGTGAHLAELRRWYEVEGADLSPAMLAVARDRLPGIQLHEADMRTLDLGRTFDVVICLFSSIGYVTDPTEMRSAVARLAAHVAPGGVLILDGWVRPGDWREGARPEPDIAQDDETLVVRLAFTSREGNITNMDMHHLVQTAREIDYFVENHRLALTPTEEYVSAVEGAGLAARVIPNYMPARDRIVGVRN
ncbi:MAG TPA: class I SAM-dependent methyltransferase [Candidatus Dormibacteraeota bacterium]|nr:class I SAM-dependent methyltransferase [Candidatus Dormibacteraeota bacterium]